MIDDLRFAARRLARRPGLVFAVVGTIAIGVGATTAIYSALRAVILRPFPYPESDRLVSITENGPQSGLYDFSVALPTYADWRGQARSFRDLALETPFRMVLSGDGEPQRVASALVSMNWFTLLGVPMALGRAFTTSDSAQVGTRLVVLSSEFWRRHFGGDRAVIGKPLTLNGAPYTVVGVAGPGLHRPDDLWIPASAVLPPEQLASRKAHRFLVVGRLAPGVTLERARDELTLISARLAAEYPESNRGWTPRVVSLSERVAGRAGPALLALMVAVLFVLLIASANVANVLLARGTTRAPEFALRLALGANRQAIVRDVLTEAALLSLVGGIVGVSLAFAGMRVLRATAVDIVPRASEMTLDASALAVALGASLLAIVIGGLPPAVFATRGAAANRLREGTAGMGRGVARSRTQHGFIVAQTALAIVLLTGAVLLLKTLVRLQSTDLGFQSERVALATFSLPRPSYESAQAQRAFVTQLLTRLSASPGVRAAGVASAVPGSSQILIYFGIPGRTFDAGSQPVTHLINVTPDYFRVLGIRVVAGRLLLPGDRDDAPPVAVVDELFAQRYFPGENALGKRVLMANDTIPREIVGIVRHVLHAGPLGANESTVYVPFTQVRFGDPTVFVRAESNVAVLAKQIHAQIRELGPGVPIYNEQTLDTRMAKSIGTTRLFSWLAALFGACAVALACIGVYGALAFSVAQRTREIGIRIALGAVPSRVTRDVVMGGLGVAAIGVALGVVVALSVTRSLAALLNTVSPTDAPSFVLAAVVFLVVAAVASLVPASRAGRVNPLVALRAD